MTGPAGIVALLLIWAAVAYRTYLLVKRPRQPATWALWRALVALALAAMFFTPVIYHGFDRFVGVPNLAELLGHGLILTSGWQSQSMLVHLVHSTSARRMIWARGCLVAATFAVASLFFTLIPADRDTTRFTTEYANAPYITHYWITFLICINVLLADVVRLVSRYAALSAREYLRFGLQLVAVGGLLGISYWCHWIVFLLLRAADHRVPAWVEVWGSVSTNSAVILIVLGSTIPAWGPRAGLRPPTIWWRDYRTYRRLYPLWNALTSEFPEIVLHPRDGRLSYRLYRRTVEILDGLLALHPYRSVEAGDTAPSMPNESPRANIDREAVTEACAIARALRARRAGKAPTDVEAPSPRNTEADAAWLAHVSKEFTRIVNAGAVNAEERTREERPRPGTMDADRLGGEPAKKTMR